MADVPDEATTVIITKAQLADGTGSIVCSRGDVRVVIFPEQQSIWDGLQAAAKSLAVMPAPG